MPREEAGPEAVIAERGPTARAEQPSDRPAYRRRGRRPAIPLSPAVLTRVRLRGRASWSSRRQPNRLHATKISPMHRRPSSSRSCSGIARAAAGVGRMNRILCEHHLSAPTPSSASIARVALSNLEQPSVRSRTRTHRCSPALFTTRHRSTARHRRALRRPNLHRPRLRPRPVPHAAVSPLGLARHLPSCRCVSSRRASTRAGIRQP